MNVKTSNSQTGSVEIIIAGEARYTCSLRSQGSPPLVAFLLLLFIVHSLQLLASGRLR